MSDNSSKSSSFGALAHRDFRLLWAGLAISAVGTWVQDVADGWLLLQLTNSPLLVGLKGGFTAVPFIAASFFGGALADRLDRRRLLMVTQSSYVAAAVTEGLLVLTGNIQVWQIYAFGSLNWIIAAIDTAARQSIIPSLVPRQDLSSAIALTSSLRRGSSILGPVIGGLTVAGLGIGAAYMVNAASFVPVVAAAIVMRVRQGDLRTRKESFGQAMVGGVRYAGGHLIIGGIIVLEAGLSFFQPIITLMPVFARDVLHVGPESYGLMLSMMGIGALLAVFSLVLLGSRVVRGSFALGAAFVYPAVMIVFALCRSFPIALGCLLLLGFLDIAGGTLRNTIVQMEVEEGYRGRVMGLLSTANRGASTLGAVPIGALAVPLGAPLAMAVGGLLSVTMVSTVGLRIREIVRFGRPSTVVPATAPGFEVEPAAATAQS